MRTPNPNGQGKVIKQFCILPYAGLDEVAIVGPFHCWPWRDVEIRNKYVADLGLQTVLQTEIDRHIDFFGRPMTSQCLVSTAGPGGFSLASGEEVNLPAALSLLAFSFLMPVVLQSPPVPEHFGSFVSPLLVRGQGYAVASAGLHHLTILIGPASVPSIRFQVPREIDGCTMGQRRLGLIGQPAAFCQDIPQNLPDARILVVGGQLLASFDDPRSQRAFGAVRWHNLALRQDPTLDHGQRPVALATAFEILFDLGASRSKAKPVCEEVDRLLSPPSERRFAVHGTKPGKVAYHVTRTSFVVHKLYMWRNKVVHGESCDVVPDATIRARGWGRRNLVLVASRVFGRCFLAKYS